MRRLFSFVAVAALAAGCNSDPFTPTIDNVSGEYVLVRFVTSTDTGSTDWVARGATLSITLVTNGVTTGQLFIPGGGTGGADLTADMGGLWALAADTVTFNQSADTFVRSMSFFATENRLSGDQTFGDVRVQVVLLK